MLKITNTALNRIIKEYIFSVVKLLSRFNPAYYPMGAGGRGVNLISWSLTSIPVPMLRICGNIPSLPHTSSLQGTYLGRQTTLYFIIILYICLSQALKLTCN